MRRFVDELLGCFVRKGGIKKYKDGAPPTALLEGRGGREGRGDQHTLKGND
jgi:hypothetical protein